ncbi:MAG: VTT domain-containing protein, partial [Pseudomonadota bacterium]|nr:VTT domain-containing protein [Pseudomonadota bacterium]
MKKNEIDLKFVSDRRMLRSLSRYGPLLLLLLGLSLCFLYDLTSYFSFAVIKAHHLQLLEHVNNNRLFSAVVYVISYTALVSFSLPGGAMMTIVGGFLFGPMPGALFAVISATLGACIIFLAARHAFSDWFRPRAGSAIFKMREGFKVNALSYLFFLRLVPIFPF